MDELIIINQIASKTVMTQANFSYKSEKEKERLLENLYNELADWMKKNYEIKRKFETSFSDKVN